jgi:glycerate kinase
VRGRRGAGAAGGIAGALLACGASIRSGFDWVAEVVGLEGALRDADLVITGEGSIDAQTARGKGPAGVAALARRTGTRVVAVAGRVDVDPTGVGGLFDEVRLIIPSGRMPADAMDPVVATAALTRTAADITLATPRTDS